MASVGATTYTEFYCDPSGDATNNLNSGSTADLSANTTYGGGTFVRATGVFTVASGNPTVDTGVTNGAWASIYTTSGATVGTCIGRITNTSTTTVTIDIGTVGGATANVSETAAAATCKVGGSWKGPNAAVGFPLTLATGNMNNSATNPPCVNLKSNALYSITANITRNALNGPIRWEGYLNNPHDGGFARIDGGTSGVSYTLLTLTSALYSDFVNIIFSNNGASGSADLVTASSSRNVFQRCVFSGSRGNGFSTSQNVLLNECEAYGNNLANAGGLSGFTLNGCQATRCISHDNAGVNTSGFGISGWATCYRCIADTNGKNGFTVASASGAYLVCCDSYNNTTAGMDWTGSTGPILVENCNFVKNGSFGINSTGTALRNGFIMNCGFGSGTQANGVDMGVNVLSGASEVYTNSNFSYAANVTPWVDPANGDFRINLTAAKAVGRGAFTETQASYAGTVGYPDIGAAQSASTNSSGGGSWTFSQ